MIKTLLNHKNDFTKGIISTNYLYVTDKMTALTGVIDLILDIYLVEKRKSELIVDQSNKIMELFKYDTLVDMETYEFFEFCNNIDKPHLVYRIVSDICNTKYYINYLKDCKDNIFLKEILKIFELKDSLINSLINDQQVLNNYIKNQLKVKLDNNPNIRHKISKLIRQNKLLLSLEQIYDLMNDIFNLEIYKEEPSEDNEDVKDIKNDKTNKEKDSKNYYIYTNKKRKRAKQQQRGRIPIKKIKK